MDDDGVTVAAAPSRGGRWRPSPLIRLVAARLAVGLVLAFVVSLLVFAAVQFLPGDAARAVLGGRATEAQLETVRAQLGLNEPAPDRYADWLGGVLRGDLGTSYRAQRPVSEILAAPVQNTLILAGVTLVLLIPLSVMLGLVAGLNTGRWPDRVITSGTLAGIALPEFVVGIALVLIFGTGLDLLPPTSIVAPGETPFSDPDILVLPVAALLIVGCAYTSRMVRASVVEVARADHVEAARLAGLPNRYVISRAILRNAIAPSIQVIAQTVQWLVGGVVVIEAVFSYPGVGSELVAAVGARDLPEVQSLVLLIAAAFIALNVLADVLVMLAVPKLRTSR